MASTKDKDDIMTDVNAPVPSKSRTLDAPTGAGMVLTRKMDSGSRDTIG